ncbi:MAG TPA: hypothetical protein VNI02_10135 [Blastocatellia bacterium]|jgi:hypothetical protein|nr:hypothetical protein [Blastocatellia bacterium]
MAFARARLIRALDCFRLGIGMYSVDQQDTIIGLEGIPQSCVGAPLPLVMSDEHVLLLAYIIQGRRYVRDGRVLTDADLDMFVEHIALVEFEMCWSCMFGSPNDETLNGHPLYSRGLTPYGAFEVEGSSWIRALERTNSVHPRHDPKRFESLHHYVFTFHDSTFECVAEGYKITEHEGTIAELMPEMQRRLLR